jgi:hypothetical protein
MSKMFIVIALAVVYTILMSVASEIRLHQVENRVKELECRHVLYEDGSSLHKDAELVRACLERG